MNYLDYTKEQLIQRITELEETNKLLKELSAIDGLTKLRNQRTLLNYLNCKINQADNVKNPLCIALFDIDDFKRINDNYGHVYGDLVLTRIADIIQNSSRETDLVGRYGGDEFMVILADTDLKVAKCIAERIRKAVEEAVFKEGLRITISGGVKQYESETFMDLIHFADINLYKAKQKGKNNIQ